MRLASEAFIVQMRLKTSEYLEIYKYGSYILHPGVWLRQKDFKLHDAHQYGLHRCSHETRRIP